MDIESDLKALGEFALSVTERAARDRSVDKFVQLSESLHRRLDRFVGNTLAQAAPPDCAAGCSHCCHALIPVTIPEVLEIATAVEGWSGDDRAALADRIGAYSHSASQYWRYDAQFFSEPCPLLVDGLCTVYAHRPSFCRGKSSYSAEDCAKHRRGENVPLAVVPGLMEASSIATNGVLTGIRKSGRYSGTYDLGLALGTLLDNPAAKQELASGETNPLNRFMIGSDRNTGMRPLNANGQSFLMPSLRPVMNPALSPEQRYQTAQTVARANPYAELCSLFMPVFYDSVEAVELWDQRFRRSLDRVRNTSLDPGLAFESLCLGAVETFGLSYNGRDVTGLVRDLGDYLHHGCAAKAYPDLVEPIEKARRPGPLRLGFVSARLWSSNGSRWALGWLTELSPEIETYAFNLGLKDDHVSTRWRRNVGHYFHIPIPTVDAARLIRQQDLDYLLITDVGMDGETIQLSMLRLARQQMTAWGHPLTTGSPVMDYFISAELMEPENGQVHYTEKLVRLPGSGQTFPAASRVPSTKSAGELGLPTNGFLLIAQNPIKLLPHRDRIYLEISERLGKPVVICDSSDGRFGPLLRDRMRNAGIKVHGAPFMQQEDFLRMIELADLVLDSFDFTGGITTINTLTLKRPLISMPGPFMRSRLSAAFMTQSGVGALLANDERDYIELACDPNRIFNGMAHMNPEPIYRDLRPVRALEQFLFESSNP